MRLTSGRIHLMAIALILVGASIASAGPSGAIFTTNADGEFVNGNVYDGPELVYLNGGPRPNAPCTAAGLPDGDYYFQVTDPSGSVLLSREDDLEYRRVHIAGGIIVAYVLPDMPDPTLVHAQGVGKCDSVTVALAPFLETPNPGREYKVWMTRVDDIGPEGAFVRSKSKTDNFKVVAPDVPDDPDGD